MTQGLDAIARVNLSQHGYIVMRLGSPLIEEVPAHVGKLLTARGDLAIRQWRQAEDCAALPTQGEVVGWHLRLQEVRVEKKTHRVNKTPRISVRGLADYMAATEIGKRAVVRECKYRSIARVTQHDEARLAVASYLGDGTANVAGLIDKAEYIRGKLADSPFEEQSNEQNADYIARFAEVADQLTLPQADLLPARQYSSMSINGVQVTFSPILMVQRTSKTNKVRRGAIMLRYAKGKPLPEQTGCFQSAAILGFMTEAEKDENCEPERGLCLTVDAYAGLAHAAPSKSVSIFNNMKAACATIAERWDNIDPPPGAVL